MRILVERDRLALLSFENANEPFREIGSGLGKDGDIIPYGLFDGFMTMQMDNAILGHASAWFTSSPSWCPSIT